MKQENQKSPYKVLLSAHITEKATMLEQLAQADSNKCVRRCQSPKAVFIVDPKANKREIAQAVETMFEKKNVKVVKVNTIVMKPKATRRRGKGRPGTKSGFKKAIVTLEPGDQLYDV